LSWSPEQIELERLGVRLVYSGGRSNICRFDQIKGLKQEDAGHQATLLGCLGIDQSDAAIRFGRGADTRRFVDAVYVLRQDYLARTAPETPQQQAAFDSVVRQYRATQPAPALPESAARLKVQAEFAVQQKRFDDAADLYEKALEIAPWWPQGRYNRGLILGELGAHAEAVRELQKYLKLEPAAPNARAVQEQVYRWESVAPSSRAAQPSATGPSNTGGEPCRSVLGCAQQQLQR
jgi:tetratricopeptide (TPR) repeat protein